MSDGFHEAVGELEDCLNIFEFQDCNITGGLVPNLEDLTDAITRSQEALNTISAYVNTKREEEINDTSKQSRA